MVESFRLASFEESKVEGLTLDISDGKLMAWSVLVACVAKSLAATTE